MRGKFKSIVFRWDIEKILIVIFYSVNDSLSKINFSLPIIISVKYSWRPICYTAYKSKMIIKKWKNTNKLQNPIDEIGA